MKLLFDQLKYFLPHHGQKLQCLSFLKFQIFHHELHLTLYGDNNKQIIILTDKGPGIPAENLDKIFEPFFTTKSRGTGLGLSIVKQIIEYHHGNLEVWSEVGVGTKFTITLSQGAKP